jgi:hypothetical protein
MGIIGKLWKKMGGFWKTECQLEWSSSIPFVETFMNDSTFDPTKISS